MTGDLATGWRIARRELRGGLEGFLVFVACLALGVATIAAVGIVNGSVVDAVRRDARVLLGGDVEIENPMQPIAAETLADLLPPGADLALQVDLNSTVAANGTRTAVVLKAVDGAYPLYGAVELEPPLAIADALADRGAVAERALAARLGLELGDRFRLGEVELTLRAFIEREPDRVGGFVSIGPRVIIDQDTLAASEVLQPGAIVDYEYRLRLPPGGDVAATVAAIREAHPEPSWRLRTADDVEPQLARTTDRLATYLTLAGLTALLVGGLGIGLAVQSYLAGKVATISTLRCLGASTRQVVVAYLLQILCLCGLGIGLGLMLGLLLPFLLLRLPEALLPVQLSYGFYPGPLLLAAGAGFLTALAFAIWPLGIAREVSPASLFRSITSPASSRPRGSFLLALALVLAALAALAVFGVPRQEMGWWFIAIAAGTALALTVVVRGLFSGLAALGERGPLPLRLAIRNLRRPGVGAGSVTVALGAGLAVLTTVTLLQANLQREIARGVPDRAPSAVFVDIQPDQLEPFKALVAAEPGVTLREAAPHLRARIVRLGGTPVEQAAVADDVRWTLNRDRGLTYRREQPPQSELAAGDWWAADYAGPPLLSVDDGIAAGYGLGVGDTITLNILGRPIEAVIANLRRDVDFASGRLEFFFIMSPGMIENAPHTAVATVEASPEAEARLIGAVGERLPNVTAISIGPVVRQISEVLEKIGLAVRIVAGVTLATGVLVLAGAIGASRRRQRQQTVILKVLGARRGDVLRLLSTEYLILGLAAAIVGALLGSIGAWLITTEVFELSWHFAPLAVGLLAVMTVGLTILIGAIATWRLLGVSAAAVLRTP